MKQETRADAVRSVDGMAEKLRRAGLRPTRQRVDLGIVLFAHGDRHISAEELHAEAELAGVKVSLATVYNALNQFTKVGLLREVAIDGTRTYFDTNITDHHHFFVEGEGRVIDMPGAVAIAEIPEPPEGMEVVSVEVSVHIRRRA